MKHSNDKKVDLGRYLTDGEYDFDSRIKGIAVRIQSDIDEVIDNYDRVEIIIPKQVYTMSKSFWKEFLGNKILELGKKKFLGKVHFFSNGRYQPDRDVREIIDEILMEKAASI